MFQVLIKSFRLKKIYFSSGDEIYCVFWFIFLKIESLNYYSYYWNGSRISINKSACRIFNMNKNDSKLNHSMRIASICTFSWKHQQQHIEFMCVRRCRRSMATQHSKMHINKKLHEQICDRWETKTTKIMA